MKRIRCIKSCRNQQKLSNEDAYKRARPSHVTLLVQNQQGLRNLFKIVSASLVKYFLTVHLEFHVHCQMNIVRDYWQVQRVMKVNYLRQLCRRTRAKLKKIAKYYDFIEIQPPALYQDLIDKEAYQNTETLHEIYQRLIRTGDTAGIPVIATGNAHYLFEHEVVSRKILITSQPGNPLNRSTLPEAHFRTTDEMLSKFHFQVKEKAHEIICEKYKTNQQIGVNVLFLLKMNYTHRVWKVLTKLERTKLYKCA